MMVKFTYCKNFAHAETREMGWDKFKSSLTHSVGYASKEESVKRSAIIGGVRSDETSGRAGNVHQRTIAILDYDDLPDGLTIEDVEFTIEMSLSCAYVAYSTFRHTPEQPRFRVAVPLSRPITEAHYSKVVRDIEAALDLGKVDSCSFVMNQIMFLPSHKHGVDPWSLSNDGDAWDVGEFEEGGIVEGGDADDLDDLMVAVASEPLDISPDQMQILLQSYPADDLDYDDWLRVGMAIYHQTEGKGFSEWVAWSEKSPKHDETHMRVKWRSFGGRTKPVTMATLIKAVGGLRGEAVAESANEIALTLEQEAEAVDSRGSYNAFKKRVQALNEVQLPPDYRSALASIVHEVYAKAARMGLREVKAAFKPVLRRSGASTTEDSVDTPEWLEGWVYGEADCVFVNTNVSDYAIKREAFRAKFDRMPEVTALETEAANFALNMVRIPTVVRSMYWPGQDRIFETEGKTFVNVYHDSGIPAADTLDGDADGQSVVDLFLQHVEMLVEEPAERDILLDFMSYIYRNPEHRVRWGLLIWGIEGNGKTYFYNILQLLLGRNAALVNTSMIERPFNDWAVGARLIGIEEIRIAGTNKWRVLDQLKPMISNDTIAVEPKGASLYHAPNFASYLMTTNHLDAVPVSDNDRRYCAIFSRHRTQSDLFDQLGGVTGAAAYFDKLFSESERRIDAIGRYLMDRELSEGFNPHGRAPATKGIEEMREANTSDDRIAVEEAIEEYASEIVSDQVLDITHLNNLVTMDAGELPQKRALGNVLRDKGLRPVDKRRVKVRGLYHYVWFRPSAKMTSKKATEIVRGWHNNDDDFSDVPF